MRTKFSPKFCSHPLYSELINLMIHYSDDDEIEVYETISGCYVDTTADIAIVADACGPVFRIDVEAGKLRKFLR